MDNVLQSLITGISLGSIYGLIGMGFTLVFSISKVINLSQGEYFTLGALSFIVLSGYMPTLLAFFAAIVIAVLIGLIIERSLMRPISSSPLINQIIMTLAIMITLQGISMLVFGKQSKTAEPVWAGAVKMGDITIQYQVLMIVAVMILINGGLYYFLHKTYYGKAFRACSSNPESVRLAGIRVNQMRMTAYGLSGAIGAISGVVIAPLLLMNYTLGLVFVVKGLVASILGGLGSPVGALLGGLLLGIFESNMAGFVSSEYKDVMTLVFLLLLLIFMPKGLVGGIKR